MKTAPLLLLMLLVSACLPSMDKSPLNFKEAPKPRIRTDLAPDRIIGHTELKEKVLNNNCLSCHQNWSDEDSFQSKWMIRGEPEKSQLYLTIKSGSHPAVPNPDGSFQTVKSLSKLEQQMIHNYILNAGSKAFRELKTKVLDNKCLSCHSSWVKNETSFLKKWVMPGESAFSEAYTTVEENLMPKPPKNADGSEGTVQPLSEEEKNLIRDYIDGLTPQ